MRPKILESSDVTKQFYMAEEDSVWISYLQQLWFWAIHGNAICRSITHYNVTWRRFRENLGTQKIVDLPVDRTSEAPPFPYCGIYMYLFSSSSKRGNIEIWNFNHLSKQHINIYIEVTSFMDTNSFILALQRFFYCRENVRFMRSDESSILVGAAKELGQALKEMDWQVDSWGWLDCLGKKPIRSQSFGRCLEETD